MAHFAELDQDNIVLRVIVVDNENLLDEGGQESEQVGVEYCERLLGGRWVQTSYNARIRKSYAGAGFTYDEDRDAFISPKPDGEWVLNEETCQWERPPGYVEPVPSDE